MKIRADWRAIAAGVTVAFVYAFWCSAFAMQRFAIDTFEGILLSVALLMLFFLWPLFRDLAIALYRVLGIRASSRPSVAIPRAPSLTSRKPSRASSRTRAVALPAP